MKTLCFLLLSIISVISNLSPSHAQLSPECPIPCSKNIPPEIELGKSKNITIQSGGVDRTYLLHVPESYNGKQNVPLILSFHGRGQNAAVQEKLSQFSNASVNSDAIAVYPQGYLWMEKNIHQWQGDPDANKSINDIQFTLDIISYLRYTYCISPFKIYATGKSNGGGLTNLLACDPRASSIIAAFAPVAGAYYMNKDGKAPDCKPSRRPVPILEFHGYEDEQIKYEGGNNTRNNGVTPAIPVWVDDWAVRNGCTPASNSTTILCGTGSKKVTRYSWECVGVADAVVHYNISNLRHQWPSERPTSDGTRTTCFEATSLILEWFRKHNLSLMHLGSDGVGA